MNAVVPQLRLLLLLHLLSKLQLCSALICWTTMEKNGRCKEIRKENTTKEECCSTYDINTAWSDELGSGDMFFYRNLGQGVACKPCKDTCNGVECGTDKVCVLRQGRPKCICSPKCKDSKKHHSKSAVCGTDGRTYENVCRLKIRACRRKSTNLSIAYRGVCKSSCDKITCPSGKHCLLDQNLSPHCVKCSRKCPKAPSRRQVCGSDGLTYQSTCHLREKACRKGKAIPLAYKGPCKQSATCTKIRCKESQNCLSDLETGAPRCVTCMGRCKPRHMSGPICATNNSTYISWCHMMKDACSRGYVLETKHSGQCVYNPVV